MKVIPGKKNVIEVYDIMQKLISKKIQKHTPKKLGT